MCMTRQEGNVRVSYCHDTLAETLGQQVVNSRSICHSSSYLTVGALCSIVAARATTVDTATEGEGEHMESPCTTLKIPMTKNVPPSIQISHLSKDRYEISYTVLMYCIARRLRKDLACWYGQWDGVPAFFCVIYAPVPLAVVFVGILQASLQT